MEEEKISKVAVCPKCGSMHLGAHVEVNNVKTNNEFNRLEKEGYDIIVELPEITRARKMYCDCIRNYTIRTMDDVELLSIPQEVRDNKYIKHFANVMMRLSNELNDVDEDDEFSELKDVRDDFSPEIRRFILTITGL